MARPLAITAFIAFALFQGATPALPAELAAAVVPALAVPAAHRLARAHAARGSRPARAARPRAAVSPGPPPGPGYCWYYIDRSTGAPGFWDLCRGR
jgi:hypothetical protein